jgi:hypothetical protein
MALRIRLARSMKATLNDNITAFGYSVLITGSYEILTRLNQVSSVLEIFCGAAGAVLAFVVSEIIMRTVFREFAGIGAERDRFFAAVMRFVSVGGGMAMTLLCAQYLNGIPAWFAGGFAGSFVFLLLDGIELSLTNLEQ